MKKLKLWKKILLVFIIIIFSAGGFLYFKGNPYDSDNPENCSLCHIMKDHYLKWKESSHSSSTACNNCHVPCFEHKKDREKFLADIGQRHIIAFITGRYNMPMKISDEGRKIVEINCLNCHGHLTQGNCLSCHQGGQAVYAAHQQPADCISCHVDTGHKTK